MPCSRPTPSLQHVSSCLHLFEPSSIRLLHRSRQNLRTVRPLAHQRCSRLHSHSAPTNIKDKNRPILRLSKLKTHSRSASNTPAAAVASVQTVRDTRSLATRIKNLLLGATIGLSIVFGYYYITDTRSSLHEYLVIPCLRYWYPDAEDAHEFGNKTLKALGRFGLQPRERGDPDAKGDLAVEVFGHVLDNPIGTSAGIDKHCEIPDVLFGAGPAIVEIGGVTPLPQEGNEKPRVWRIPSQRALVNRYGLNSEGADFIVMRLRQRLREYAYHLGWGIDEQAENDVLDGNAGVPPGSLSKGKLLAVQMAKNKWTKDDDIEAVKQDYIQCTSLLSRYADIVVINVSSPNTPGLRLLQKTEPLTEILTAVVGAARKVKRKNPVHVMVKVSPDEDSEEDVRGICDAVWDSGVDGVVVGNTTKRRPDPLPNGQRLTEQERRILFEQEGGYSGYQTFHRTVALVKRYRTMLDESSYITEDEADSASPRNKPPSDPELYNDQTGQRAKSTSSGKDDSSMASSIASTAKSALLETHQETQPPITDSEVDASVARDEQHLKPQTPESEANSSSQPIIRLPERSNPFSSSSNTSNNESSSPPAPPEASNLLTSSTDDTPQPLSPSPTSATHSSSSNPPKRKVIFATGGITNGSQALEVLRAGADVAQVYTALVYGGIGTISKMKMEMREELAANKKKKE